MFLFYSSFNRRTLRLCVKDNSHRPIYPREDSSEPCMDDGEEDTQYERISLWPTGRSRSDSVDTGSQSINVNNARDPISVDGFDEYMESVKDDEFAVLLDEFRVSRSAVNPLMYTPFFYSVFFFVESEVFLWFGNI